MNDFKTVNGLIKHIRVSGIAIGGSKEKRKLINYGYFHGYKGYRCYKPTNTILPFASFKEITATVEYDSSLKAIIYPKLMFIETALSSITCQAIIEITRSESIYSMLNIAIENYQRCNPTLPQRIKQKKQNNFFKLQKSLESEISKAYNNDNPRITHYINSPGRDVPIWALFDILTLGTLHTIIQDSIFSVRDSVSNSFGIYRSIDTNREFLSAMVSQLRFLRNSVAHNDIIFDRRFKVNDAPRTVYNIFKTFSGLTTFSCDNIFEYFVVIAWFLKQLKCNKTEIINFLKAYQKATDVYVSKVPAAIRNIVIPRGYRLLVATVISNL